MAGEHHPSTSRTLHSDVAAHLATQLNRWKKQMVQIEAFSQKYEGFATAAAAAAARSTAKPSKAAAKSSLSVSTSGSKRRKGASNKGRGTEAVKDRQISEHDLQQCITFLDGPGSVQPGRMPLFMSLMRPLERLPVTIAAMMMQCLQRSSKKLLKIFVTGGGLSDLNALLLRAKVDGRDDLCEEVIKAAKVLPFYPEKIRESGIGKTLKKEFRSAGKKSAEVSASAKRAADDLYHQWMQMQKDNHGKSSEEVEKEKKKARKAEKKKRKREEAEAAERLAQENEERKRAAKRAKKAEKARAKDMRERGDGTDANGESSGRKKAPLLGMKPKRRAAAPPPGMRRKNSSTRVAGREKVLPALDTSERLDSSDGGSDGGGAKDGSKGGTKADAVTDGAVKKKSVTWAPEGELAQVRYFETFTADDADAGGVREGDDVRPSNAWASKRDLTARERALKMRKRSGERGGNHAPLIEWRRPQAIAVVTDPHAPLPEPLKFPRGGGSAERERLNELPTARQRQGPAPEDPSEVSALSRALQRGRAGSFSVEQTQPIPVMGAQEQQLLLQQQQHAAAAQPQPSYAAHSQAQYYGYGYQTQQQGHARVVPQYGYYPPQHQLYTQPQYQQPHSR
jgi:hypothetical protein